VGAADGSDEQRKEAVNGTILYKYSGKAEGPAKAGEDGVGYDLIPIYTTLWARARERAGATFGGTYDFGTLKVAAGTGKAAARQVKVGAVGTAFLGKVGAANMARAPWGWFDTQERKFPLGGWFFDPAGTVKRHFSPKGAFSVAYVHNPPLGIFRGQSQQSRSR
jgi:hypothetical protein